MQTGGRSLRWSVLRLPCFGFFLLTLATPIFARQVQSGRRIPERSPASTATLQGVIRDSYGRAIPGVLLDLQSTTPGQHYSASTNAEGIFRLRDVRLGTYEVKLSREGFEAQTVSNFKVSGPVTLLELALRESSEAVPAATCPSGVPGMPCAAAPTGATTPYPGMRGPVPQEAPAQVPAEQIPRRRAPRDDKRGIPTLTRRAPSR